MLSVIGPKNPVALPKEQFHLLVLFIIYMEGMLQTILPTATMLGIQVAMYADDFSLWNTGYSIPSLATNLSILINKHIVPWLETYNMKLSIWKCHSFLFTLYHRDPNLAL